MKLLSDLLLNKRVAYSQDSDPLRQVTRILYPIGGRFRKKKGSGPPDNNGATYPASNKKLLGAPGIATRSILTSKKDATCLETLFGQTDYDTDEQTTKWSAGPRTL